jgi:hypothetical protein
MRVSVVGIAWYKKEDYKTLLSLFTDSEKLASSYEEWLKDAECLLDQLRRNGHAFQKVYIDPKTFPTWCATRGLNIDAKARIRFANESVAGKYSDGKR